MYIKYSSINLCILNMINGPDRIGLDIPLQEESSEYSSQH